MKVRPFEDVVDEHGPVVMRVCRALLGPVDADDAWAETFMAALRSYPDLRPDSNVKGWLVTIAHRKAIDHLRQRARAPVPTAQLSEAVSVDSFTEATDDALRDAVRALPSKQRRAVIYHHIVGLPYAEIGPLIDSSEAAARRSGADGIAALRKTYGRGGPS